MQTSHVPSRRRIVTVIKRNAASRSKAEPRREERQAPNQANDSANGALAVGSSAVLANQPPPRRGNDTNSWKFITL
jgi:hypothetical protein